MTNERGERTFAYCFKFSAKGPIPSQLLTATFADEVLGPRHFPFNPYSVLVFVSNHPHEKLFYRCLQTGRSVA